MEQVDPAKSGQPPAQPVPHPQAPTAPVTPQPVINECALLPGAGEPVMTVGLHQPIDPSHAPRPSNDSERLVFRQLYETLVSADCLGRIGAGLASSWRLDGDGRTWLVTLRQDARFSDGSPVTAADVRASWTGGSAEGELRPEVSRLVASVELVGERDLAIVLRHQAGVGATVGAGAAIRTEAGAGDAPLALAHADLAVARTVAGAVWPLGTRAGRVSVEGEVAGSRGASVVTISRGDASTLRLVIAAGDPRDLLDQDVDLLLTRDPSTLGYAATQPKFQAVPMNWQRTHVLLMPGRARSAPMLSEDGRRMLAIDAIRGEARGARGPFWWETVSAAGACEAPAPGIPLNAGSGASSLAPRIVYDASDDAARELAERFVGLARASGAPQAAPFLDVILPDRPRRSYQRAAGLSGDALATARRLGRDAGFIVAVDSRPLDPCRDMHALLDTARWLDPATIVPLVETRLQAIVRRGRTGIITEWDGGVLLAGPAPANEQGRR